MSSSYSIETSCHFILESNGSKVALLDLEEVGFTKNLDFKDQFSYALKLQQNIFLNEQGILKEVAGVLSQIHSKIPDLAQHLFDRMIHSKIQMSKGDEVVNNESCLHDLIHLQTPILSTESNVILPFGLVQSHVYIETPGQRKESIYNINSDLFNKLDKNQKVATYFSMVTKDYLMLSRFRSSSYGLFPRNFNAQLLINLSASDERYIERLEKTVENQIEHQTSYTESFRNSFSFKKIKELDSIQGNWSPLNFAPHFTYLSQTKLSNINQVCHNLKVSLDVSSILIKSSLDKINRRIKSLLLEPRSKKCLPQFLNAKVFHFMEDDGVEVCESDLTPSYELDFLEVDKFMYNSYFFKQNIHEQSYQGFGGGIYRPVVKVILENQDTLILDLNSNLDWGAFKKASYELKNVQQKIRSLNYQCREINYTDIVSFRSLEVLDEK